MKNSGFLFRLFSWGVVFSLSSIPIGCFSKSNKSDSDTIGLLLAALVLNSGTRPVTMINLGDSLTNGDQSGATHEFSQSAAFPQLLAKQMLLRETIPWNNPLLYATGGSAGTRKEPNVIPYNLGVNGLTTKTLIGTTAVSGGTNHIDKILAPLPVLLGKPTTQLEAAEYVGTLNPDRTLIITLWIGGNDVLGAVTASNGTALTTTAINNFLNDTSAQHDITSVKANLTAIVNRLKVLPKAEVFIATLPDISGIGFLLTQSDFQKLAHTTDTLNITNFGSCQALGFGSLIGTGAADSLMNQLDGNNATLNAVIGGYAGNDGTCLTAAEGSLVTNRVNDINSHIRALTIGNVHLVDIDSMFKRVLNGEITVNGKTLGKTFSQGGLFSFDGVHPSHTGHGLIANTFIEAINNSLQLNLSLLDLTSIQSFDPYRDDDKDGFARGPVTATSPINTSLGLHFPDCDDSNNVKYAKIVHGGGGSTGGTCP